jgi:hypothetical protein
MTILEKLNTGPAFRLKVQDLSHGVTLNLKQIKPQLLVGQSITGCLHLWILSGSCRKKPFGLVVTAWHENHSVNKAYKSAVACSRKDI